MEFYSIVKWNFIQLLNYKYNNIILYNVWNIWNDNKRY